MKLVKDKLPAWYERLQPISLMDIRVAFFFLLVEVFCGTLGFIYLEGYSFLEGLYMTIITISTVGYTEVRPLSEAGRLFATLLIIANILIFGYFVSVFTYYVTQGELFKNIKVKVLQSKIRQLRDHVILCGYGRYGREVARHLDLHQIPYVVVENEHAVVEEMKEHEPHILTIEDDATHDEVLLEAGIQRARYLISALPDDTDNVFTVLTARQLNPRLKIISRASEERSVKKLRISGADHVIMPEQIGGFYMATLVNRPGAIEFFSIVTNEFQTDIDFEEFAIENLPPACCGKSIKELNIRKHTGANVVGYRTPQGKYSVNPPPETVLEPGSSIIVLGSREQLERLRAFFQGFA
ncbi:MAG: potassium channel protein [Bacteroidetes bacterium]|nr:MAG: potassium channel protein [Bacteroidota bacterium]